MGRGKMSECKKSIKANKRKCSSGTDQSLNQSRMKKLKKPSIKIDTTDCQNTEVSVKHATKPQRKKLNRFSRVPLTDRTNSQVEEHSNERVEESASDNDSPLESDE